MQLSRPLLRVAVPLVPIFLLATGGFSVAASQVVTRVGSASGTPSESVPVGVTIDAGGEKVFAMQLDLGFDPLAPIAATPEMRPDCVVNPAIERTGTVFVFRPRGCTPGLDCTAVRALILAFGNPDPIPNGSTLLTCSVDIDASAPTGTYPLPSSNCAASDRRGRGLKTSCFDGEVTVVEPTPPTARRLFLKTPSSGARDNTLAFRAKGYPSPLPRTIEQDPRCPPDGSGSTRAGASLRVFGTGGDFSIDLPCAQWSLNSTGTRFTYRDPTGATCNLLTVKQGVLERAVCRGPQIAYTLGDAQDTISVGLTIAAAGPPNEVCASFGSSASTTILHDGSDGESYLARDSRAPELCPRQP